MNAVFDRFQLIVSQSVLSVYDRVWALLPEILFAIVVIFIGWIAAVLIHHVVLWVLNFFAIDKLSAKTPLQGMLRSIGIHKSISDILGWLVFWLIVLLTLIIAADTLHLNQVSQGLAVISSFIPQLIAALLIVIFGMLLAKFLQMLTTQTLNKMDISYKKFAGKAVQLAVLIFVFVAAIDQLGLNVSSVMNGLITVFSVVLLMLGLGAAFGARTVLDNTIACQQLRRQLPVGSRVTIAGTEGTVREFTLTSVVLDTAGHTKVLPAVHFFTHAYDIQ